MLISSIINTYNQSKELQKILESYEAQPFKDLEVIVVSDGSKENDLTVVKKDWSFPVKYIWHPDTGFNLAKCRNMGAKIAEGQYVHFIDGDTLIGQNTFEAFLLFLDDKTLFWGERQIISRDILDRPISNLDNLIVAPDFRQNSFPNLFSGSNFILPRDKYLEVQWNEKFKTYGLDDYDFFTRWTAQERPFAGIRASVAYHLEHPPKPGHPDSEALLQATQQEVANASRNRHPDNQGSDTIS